MNSNNSRYGIRSNGLNHGDVFTSSEVVQFMLDSIGYISEVDLSHSFILEPSFGNGEFLLEIFSRITESAKKHGYNPVEVFQKCVFGSEIDREKYEKCISRLRILMPDCPLDNLRNEDFLMSNWKQNFDFIVGNPPYVRYENIPEDIRNIYKTIFKTFHYRCDLYVLFFEKSLSLLNPHGKHCFICSNRWLRNEYGKKLRLFISNNFNLVKLIDVERLDAFQEKVLAYPAITVITNSSNKHEVEFACIYSTQELKDYIEYDIRKYHNIDDLGTIFYNIKFSSLPTIEEQNFSIGIGVATGADRIFISKELPAIVENELLLPIICAKDLSGNKFQYGGLYLLNPTDKVGNLINLDNYPMAKAYLEQYRTHLQKRHIVKNNRKWYSLIDKIKPDIQYKSKILLPDISANTHIFVDEGKYYPAHNIYYIISNNEDNEQLLLLAAILMSDIVKEQMLNLSNKMNGGFPRWQSQALRKLRIPCLSAINSELKSQLLSAYKGFNIKEINRIVNMIMESQSTRFRYKHYNIRHIQPSLFDFPNLS